ncbi:MAG: hypothetical protein ACLFOC_10585, partial [Campylobacterales bacterium]
MKFLKVNRWNERIYDAFCQKYDLNQMTSKDIFEKLIEEGYWSSDFYEKSLIKLYGWECLTIPFSTNLNNKNYIKIANSIFKPLFGFDFDFQRGYVSLLNFIEDYNPDILYLAPTLSYTDSVISEARRRAKNIKKIMGWNCMLVSEEEYQHMKSYDAIFTCVPDINEMMLRKDIKSYNQGLSFDPEILDKIEKREKRHDIVFTGTIRPCKDYRLQVMQEIEKSGLNFEIYCPNKDYECYFNKPFSPPVFGLDMYQLLADSKIILNIHATTKNAGNLRLYEATGIGTCLLTDRQEGLEE